MLYRCHSCRATFLRPICSDCGVEGIDDYVPLDPRFYPEFQYVRQGIVSHVLFKRKAQQELMDKRAEILRKYEQLRDPYFVNFVNLERFEEHLPEDTSGHEPLRLFLSLIHI